MNTDQIDIWESDFGKQYTDRNNFKSEIRLKSWSEMLPLENIESVLEVGCNRGKNLECISKIKPDLKIFGVEPNDYAVNICKKLKSVEVNKGTAFNLPFEDSSVDLVFTANVLIHIALEDLQKAMLEINRVSKKYILCIEYIDDNETNIHYRGHDNALWKRNFKKHYEDTIPGLKLVKSGFWSWDSGGFDDSHWYLWEKNV